MRGNLETIVGAMFAGKTSELLKRILWAKHQNKKIIVIKPSIDNRYSNEKIITHNDLSHECFAMSHWDAVLKKFSFEKKNVDMVFLDEIQFMDTHDTLNNVEVILSKGIDVVCAGLDQDSRGERRPGEPLLQVPWPGRPQFPAVLNLRVLHEPAQGLKRADQRSLHEGHHPDRDQLPEGEARLEGLTREGQSIHPEPDLVPALEVRKDQGAEPGDEEGA